MPKLKTNRAAAKRFKRTASGKWKRSHALARHLMSTKSKKRKRNLRQSALVNPSFQDHLDRLLPYGGY